MRGALFASLLVLTATATAATRKFRKFREEPGHPGEHNVYYPERPADKTCEELCKEDTGMDADTCVTECEVHTDLATHSMDHGVEDFATDEAYNEKDGKKIEEKAEADHPVEVLDCAPEVDIDKAPTLEEIDTKQDGVIDEEEAKNWGHKACVPDEMTEQIFHQADKNVDHTIDAEEFARSGEDTVHEEAIDDALEKDSEGDDEYNPVQTPPLEEFDDNNDGGLDKEEHSDAVDFEKERRDEGRWSVSEGEIPDSATDEAFEKVDADGDGKIEGDEYIAEPEDGGSDMGEEIKEAAAADEDAADPDDLPKAGDDTASPAVEGAAEEPAGAASMLSTRFKVAQRDEAAFLRRFNLPERSQSSFGHAFAQVARKHQALRKQNKLMKKTLRRHRGGVRPAARAGARLFRHRKH